MSAATSAGLLRSTGAATFVQLWRIGVLFGTNLLLRRWIGVEAWGLWQWAEALFILVATVRDLGVSSHVVRLQPRPFGTFLLMQLAWGSFLAGAILVAAPTLALLNQQPDAQTVAVIRALGVFLWLEGLATVALVHFEAELSIQRTLVPEVVRSTVQSGLAIFLAWRGVEVWSLVAAQIVAAALFAALLWWRAWGHIRLDRAPGGVLALLRGGLPVGGVWMLGHAVAYLDPLVLANFFRKAVVGTYTFAYFAAFLPARILQLPMQRALYPALVAYRGDAERTFAAYRLATLVLVGLEVPAAMFLAANGGIVLQLLGGHQWAGAERYLLLLAFAPVVDPFGRFAGELLIANRLERVRVLSLVTTLATMLGAALLLIPWLGPAGMAVANLLPFGGLVAAWGVHALVRERLWSLLRDLAGVYLVPVPLFAVAIFAAGDSPWLRFGLTAVAAAAALGLQWRRFGKGFLAFFRAAPESGADDAPASPLPPR